MKAFRLIRRGFLCLVGIGLILFTMLFAIDSNFWPPAVQARDRVMDYTCVFLGLYFAGSTWLVIAIIRHVPLPLRASRS
jgi:hypothetical protein